MEEDALLVQRMLQERKRQRGKDCPALQTEGWLQRKRVCLLGPFSRYSRESVVRALRAEGALLSFDPAADSYDLVVAGEEVTQLPPPPVLRESQLLLPRPVWVRRFDIQLPWYQHFAPQTEEELLGQSSLTLAGCVRRWLLEWEQGSGSPALLLYGIPGCGKKTVVQAVLRSRGYEHIVDVCAASDGGGSENSSTAKKSSSASSAVFSEYDSLVVQCSLIQGNLSNPMKLTSAKSTKSALFCHCAAQLNCKKDRDALLRLLKRRLLPVVFFMQASEYEPKACFLKHFSLYCRSHFMSAPSPAELQLLLQSVYQKLTGRQQCSSEMQALFQQLAESARGDMRACLLALECSLRFRSVSLCSKERAPSVRELLLGLTSPLLPAAQKAELLTAQGSDCMRELEQVLPLTLPGCGAGHVSSFCSSLSDAMLFYKGSAYRATVEGLTAACHLQTVQFQPWENPKNAKKALRTVLDHSRQRELSPSFRLLSPSAYNLELLSAFPSLRAPLEPSVVCAQFPSLRERL